jgi:predicted secreted protein
MKKEAAICLQNHFVNNMKVGGELAWFVKDFNASTGYHWSFRPDLSGVYEMVEEVILHPSTDAVGVPGKIIWKFKASREGLGNIMFELFPPSGEKAVETIIVEIKVVK